MPKTPPPKPPRYVKTLVPILNRKVAIHAATRVAAVMKRAGKMPALDGVKVLDLIQAAYLQGKRDGARAVKESVEAAMKSVPHQNPRDLGNSKRQSERELAAMLRPAMAELEAAELEEERAAELEP